MGKYITAIFVMGLLALTIPVSIYNNMLSLVFPFMSTTDYWGSIRTNAETIAMGELYNELNVEYMRLGILKINDNASAKICESINANMEEYLNNAEPQNLIYKPDRCLIEDGKYKNVAMDLNIPGLKKYEQLTYPKLEFEFKVEIVDRIKKGDYSGADKIKDMEFKIELEAITIPEEFRR